VTRRICIAVRDGVTPRTECFAQVMVDWARLMIVDLDAFGSWEHDRPLDGLPEDGGRQDADEDFERFTD
jgi:hypothetical protein